MWYLLYISYSGEAFLSQIGDFLLAPSDFVMQQMLKMDFFHHRDIGKMEQDMFMTFEPQYRKNQKGHNATGLFAFCLPAILSRVFIGCYLTTAIHQAVVTGIPGDAHVGKWELPNYPSTDRQVGETSSCSRVPMKEQTRPLP